MSRELDAKVAEKVMGWRYPFSAERMRGEWRDHWHDEVNKTLYLPEQLPWFTSTAGDDYEVLRHVREKWAAHAWLFFIEQLHMQFSNRANDLGWASLAASYEPGDYSKAALMALGEDIG